MLRLLIIIGVFFIVFHFVYKWMKKKVYWINRELADEVSLKDKKEQINKEREKFDESLKQKEIELKQEQKEIKKLKK